MGTVSRHRKFYTRERFGNATIRVALARNIVRMRRLCASEHEHEVLEGMRYVSHTMRVAAAARLVHRHPSPAAVAYIRATLPEFRYGPQLPTEGTA